MPPQYYEPQYHSVPQPTPDYWTGLVEGFQGRREAEYRRNYDRELQNRQLADRVFGYLMQSRDPELQQLALRGLMSPVNKKKGFRGFMGEVEPAVDPLLSQIVTRMNEEVPSEMPAAPAPPPQGAAAMPTNQPVRPGSAPIQLDPGAADVVSPMEAAPVTPPPLGPTGGAPAMGGAPPPSPFKRRGTGVPTAEEIAEMNAYAQLQGRITAASRALRMSGASEEEVQSAILGMAGAPRPTRTLSAVTQWGVKLPGSDTVVPVLLDQDKGYVTAGGTPLPPGAQMVRMSGGAGGGGALTSTVEDSPEARQQLIALGADPSVVARGTATGYWRMRQAADGSIMVQPGEYTPPPAYSGTTVIAEPGTGVPVRAPVLRGGGTGSPLGDDPGAVKSQLQMDAEALKQAVDDEVNLQLKSLAGRTRGVTPAARDAIVRQKAAGMNLPYRSYDEVTRATRATAPVTPRERSEGGTVAERVLRRAMENRQGGGETPAAPAGPPRAPVRPSMRSQGPGPRK